MPLVIEYFPPAFILLQQEIKWHPELIDRLQAQPENEFEIRMLAVARYCDIILEGTYQPADWIRLAEICLEKLKAKRPGRSDIMIVHQMPQELQ